MNRINIDNEQLKEKNPYRVPDGYFSDLRYKLQDKIAQEQAPATSTRGVWRRISGVAGAMLSYVCLIMVALVGFYFTGYRANLREIEENDMLTYYTVYAEDLEDLLYDEFEDEAFEESGIVFAQAVNEYLDIHGYGYLDSDSLPADE